MDIKSRDVLVQYRAVRGLGPSKLMTSAGEPGFSSLVDLGDDFSSQKLHVSPVYLLVMKWFN